jgi:hypothetical protein
MKPPENADILEIPASITWMDEEGYICSVSRKAPPQSMEDSIRSMEGFVKKYGNKKYCFLLDIIHAAPSDREAREYAEKKLPNIARAIAIISNSVFGKMLGNLFLGLNPPAYPAKIFDNETEARSWLRQYLDS